ncbi:MAG: magnesium and cobalt transport protein CorA [Deltaproteobacteria bacterium HGW-Deltaproteobacteria-11]|nr:MAG: magnesium and cobalt transport protein CorA [Deltaproteobacteria bacterium HGW-Deltaproteobacteria-11]
MTQENLEDILNTDQRPKMQDMGDYMFIVLKRFCNTCDEHSDITAEQVSIILGPNYVISLQERAETLFDPIRERIKTSKGRIRKTGADYLAYAIIDMILDSYFGILETLGEKIEIEEEALVNNPAQSTLRVIQHLKRDMIFLRKSIWPLRETISALERSESPLIQDATGIYLKDIYDHAIQVIDTVETYREMLSGMIDIYLSSLSNRMNQVMKVLTIIATIFIPLTFLAGVYGMNFKHFPELEWHWGYLFFWITSMTIAVVMLILFKRKKWF